jgi:hypothetical protein
MADNLLYGACRKKVDGEVDGCGMFAVSEDRPNFCEACEHHKNFHIVPKTEVVKVVEGRGNSCVGLSKSELEGECQSPVVASKSKLEPEVRRSPRTLSAKRVLNVSESSAANTASGSAASLTKKVKVEPGTQASKPEHNPYARALADLQKEFNQEGPGKFEFRREGGEWRVWCCLCENLNKVGPGSTKLGNFKKHFDSKKHQDLVEGVDVASAKKAAAEAKVNAQREKEEVWLSRWASEGGLQMGKRMRQDMIE